MIIYEIKISLLVLLLKIRKYLSIVSFPRVVMSAFIGFILYFRQDLGCVIVRSISVNQQI